MEKDAPPASDPKRSIGTTATLSASLPPQREATTSPLPLRASDALQKHHFSANFASLYNSLFSPGSTPKKSSPPSSPPRRSSPGSTPHLQSSQESAQEKSAPSSDEHQKSSICSNSSTSANDEDKLEQAYLVLEYQNLQKRYHLCRSYVQDLTNEINSLRRENASLRLAKTELVNLLSVSSQATMRDCLRRLSNVDLEGRSEFGVDEYSPTSVLERNRLENPEPERLKLPKSISVRSSSYLKGNPTGSVGLSRPALVRASTDLEAGKRMYLPGTKKELEVYNQGMFKTELCNKWQETGACPYGDHCQFAHGISELRPVIRHPRYKTEVCRMVLAGDSCPYGHRCHFRHSLTEQEMMLSGPR